MADLGISRVLARARREKGISQEELAQFIGVSKAYVSKWETGQSYPDITFLPLLASYFGISIDELLNYQPQMDARDIGLLIERLKADFEHKPFDEVHEACRAVARKYCACYPLLNKMASLLLNHSPYAGSPERQLDVIRESAALSARVRTESGQGELILWATGMEAACALALGEPEAALELLGAQTEPIAPFDPLRADALVRLGRPDPATEILQVGVYQHLLVVCEMLAQLLTLYPDRPDKYRAVAERLSALDAAFALRALHPGVMINLYLQMGIGYAGLRLEQDAVAALRTCLEMLADPAEFALHGDGFFDRIDGWLRAKCDAPPVSKRAIRLQGIGILCDHPALAALGHSEAYQQIRQDALRMKERLS